MSLDDLFIFFLRSLSFMYLRLFLVPFLCTPILFSSIPLPFPFLLLSWTLSFGLSVVLLAEMTGRRRTTGSVCLMAETMAAAGSLISKSDNYNDLL